MATFTLGAGDNGNERPRVLIPGRRAALEALANPRVRVAKVVVSTAARGDEIDAIESAARRHGVLIEQASERRLTSLADDRLHQGVVTDIDPPEPVALEAWLADRTGRLWETSLLVLDGIHNPANVGMILRTAAGAGVDAVVLPRVGTAEIGPQTVKAGSGMIFAVDIVDVESSEEAARVLGEHHVDLVGLDAGGDNLYDAELPTRAAYVLGNETLGLSPAMEAALDSVISIPLCNGVESLNVAAAAAVIGYELLRRKRVGTGAG